MKQAEIKQDVETMDGPLQVLTVLPQLLTVLKEYEMVVFGALMMVTMIFFPRGIVPTLGAWFSRWRR